MTLRPILMAALVLGGFAVTGATLVAITNASMAERIVENQRLAMQRKLAVIVPGGGDNDPLVDRIEVTEPALLGSERTRVYRVRRAGQPVALILDPVVPHGYAGPIKLLISVLPDGRVGGLRVIAHHETPGLGDKIDEARSDWVYQFNGKSLALPTPQGWAVKRDGGAFDQFTGATITPRAIVKAVKNTLLFVQAQGERLYSEPPITPRGSAEEASQ